VLESLLSSASRYQLNQKEMEHIAYKQLQGTFAAQDSELNSALQAQQQSAGSGLDANQLKRALRAGDTPSAAKANAALRMQIRYGLQGNHADPLQALLLTRAYASPLPTGGSRDDVEEALSEDGLPAYANPSFEARLATGGYKPAGQGDPLSDLFQVSGGNAAEGGYNTGTSWLQSLWGSPLDAADRLAAAGLSANHPHASDSSPMIGVPPPALASLKPLPSGRPVMGGTLAAVATQAPAVALPPQLSQGAAALGAAAQPGIDSADRSSASGVSPNAPRDWAAFDSMQGAERELARLDAAGQSLRGGAVSAAAAGQTAGRAEPKQSKQALVNPKEARATAPHAAVAPKPSMRGGSVPSATPAASAEGGVADARATGTGALRAAARRSPPPRKLCGARAMRRRGPRRRRRGRSARRRSRGLARRGRRGRWRRRQPTRSARSALPQARRAS